MSDAIPSSAPPAIRATIHLGASSISLLISRELDDGSSEKVDFLEQSAPIAHDIFSKGKLSRSCIERCVMILQGYQDALAEFGSSFSTATTRLVATNIVSEASNKDVLINRIRISTGVDIEILDDGEMTRLIYLKTKRRLADMPSMKKRNTLVLHVGPGNTRAILFKKGRIVSYNSYRLGTHRTGEALNSILDKSGKPRNLVRQHIRGQLETIVSDYADADIQDVVLIGYEIQHLSQHILHHKDKSCSLKQYRQLCDEALSMDDDEIVKNYQVDYHTAEALIPSLEINLAVTEALELKRLHIPASHYERGLLQDLYISPSLALEFSDEVIRSAQALASRYKVHKQHSQTVARLALSLFEQLQELHEMTPHDALLLHTAAILHECGGFINSRAHHKHSQYLILNSEIFGLAYSDIELIALIARYHRNSPPKPGHSIYRDLNGDDRIRVSKLASLLRVADALDRTHSGRVQEIQVRIGRRRLHLHLKHISDANTERLAMRSKSDLFENIFGLEINLVEDRNS